MVTRTIQRKPHRLTTPAPAIVFTVSRDRENKEAVQDLLSVRRQIITFLADSPGTVENLGKDSIGSLSLKIGNCLTCIGSILDRYSNGQVQHETVSGIGEEFQKAGRKLLSDPDRKALKKTIRTLRKQCDALQMVLELQEAESEQTLCAENKGGAR